MNQSKSTTKKAKWAASAVLAYADRVGSIGEDLSQNVADLLADLRHLCGHYGLDFVELDRRAHGYYVEEASLGRERKRKK